MDFPRHVDRISMELPIMYFMGPTYVHVVETISLHSVRSQVEISKREQCLSGRVLDSRPRGCRFQPHQHYCIVSLSKTH